MKKLIICAALAATGCLTTAAWADEECQAGSAYGTKPGCSGPSYGPTTPLGVMGNSGVLIVPSGPDYPYFRNDAEERAWQAQRGRRGAQHNRRDRDGDGVDNRDDRYPDNPRRW